MEGLVQLLPIVGIVLIFWLLIIRPASRRARETARMQGGLEIGAEVLLTSGIYGTIISLTDDRMMLQVAPEVTLEVARGAVGAVISEDLEGSADDDPTDHTASAASEHEEG